MPSRTVDDLWEKLLSDEDVDPGLLVRMDRDIKELKGNPMVIFGRHFRSIGAAVGALAAAAYAVLNFGGIITMVQGALAASPKK